MFDVLQIRKDSSKIRICREQSATDRVSCRSRQRAESPLTDRKWAFCSAIHPSIGRSFERGSEPTTERFRRLIREEREEGEVMWHFWPSEIEPNVMDEILRWDIFDDGNNFDIDSSLERSCYSWCRMVWLGYLVLISRQGWAKVSLPGCCCCLSNVCQLA